MLSQLLGNPEIKIFENKTFLIETLYANDTRRHAFSMFNACIVSPSCKLDWIQYFEAPKDSYKSGRRLPTSQMIYKGSFTLGRKCGVFALG